MSTLWQLSAAHIAVAESLMAYGRVCTHVLQVTFNPKDSNTFASASLDRTIKVRTQDGCNSVGPPWSCLQSLHASPTATNPQGRCLVCWHGPKTYASSAEHLLHTCLNHLQVWSLGQPTPNFTLEGHEKGVNCVDYFNGGDRPFLISGADDRLVKVWP